LGLERVAWFWWLLGGGARGVGGLKVAIASSMYSIPTPPRGRDELGEREDLFSSIHNG